MRSETHSVHNQYAYTNDVILSSSIRETPFQLLTVLLQKNIRFRIVSDSPTAHILQKSVPMLYILCAYYNNIIVFVLNGHNIRIKNDLLRRYPPRTLLFLEMYVNRTGAVAVAYTHKILTQMINNRSLDMISLFPRGPRLCSVDNDVFIIIIILILVPILIFAGGYCIVFTIFIMITTYTRYSHILQLRLCIWWV